jgi:PAS domain S-box-containing protein
MLVRFSPTPVLEHLNQAILQMAPYPIIATDAHGVLLIFNRHAERTLGYPAGEVLGRTPALWHDPEEIAARAAVLTRELGAQVRPGVSVFTAQPLLSGSECREWTLIRKDGSRFCAIVTVTLLTAPDGTACGFVVTLEDNSERIATHQALTTNEDTFRTAMEDASIGMALVSPQGGWLSINKTLCAMLGYSPAEMMETDFQSLTHPDDLDLVPMARLLDGAIGTYRQEKRYLAKGGRIVWVMVSVSLVRNADFSPRHFITHVLDITERKAVERRKSEFIACVSHGLRTPLTSIRGALGLLAGGIGGELSDNARRLVDIAHDGSCRLGRLVDDILLTEKLQSGAVAPRLESRPAKQLLQSVLASHHQLAVEHGVTMRLAAAADTAHVCVDVDHFHHAIGNLVSNAAKFATPGSVVEIETVTDEDILHILVRDRGTVIPAEFRAHAFEPFSLADTADNSPNNGTGLGLHIARKLIETMGGSIDYESDDDTGTVFHVELPLYGAGEASA